MQNGSNITQLLHQYGSGDKMALEQLSPLIYTELKKISRRLFSHESSHHTLQPTALVNEVFIKLVDVNIGWQDRAHFYALAARMMRRMLVDHAKAKMAAKRGGEGKDIAFNTFIEDRNSSAGISIEMLSLNDAIETLASKDSRKAQLIELQYFAGLNFAEMAIVTGLSTSTIDRELRFSRALLKTYLTNN
ncbi:ECF-type sigma factor [uncultured Paraglaciecola sp.]|uniref:ECF-type sigma factor n=1 Tax=uncultured Paraglaciecola sp. TaxID=1765024 RepID=UPI0030DBBC6A|tara:strand:+ start:78106 stop:78675 length:570 start_codon:yes stop_codon:yes gene_type:complete